MSNGVGVLQGGQNIPCAVHGFVFRNGTRPCWSVLGVNQGRAADSRDSARLRLDCRVAVLRLAVAASEHRIAACSCLSRRNRDIAQGGRSTDLHALCNACE
eukprot:1945653-Pleurochrysis_carterae.AAC.2